MGDAESMAETLSQLNTLVKKVETTMGAMQKAFHALEKRVSRLEVQGRKSVPIEVEEELAPHEKDDQKRMVYLKTVWSPYIDSHLKEGHGLFMEGNASKEAMYRIFGQAPTPDSEMTYNEQRKLAMWVTSSLKVWRRKDYLRALKKTYQKLLSDMKAELGRAMTKAEMANAAIKFVDEEVIFRHSLVERPAGDISPMRTEAVPSVYKRFLLTVLHNVLDKSCDEELPKSLQKRSPTNNANGARAHTHHQHNAAALAAAGAAANAAGDEDEVVMMEEDAEDPQHPPPHDMDVEHHGEDPDMHLEEESLTMEMEEMDSHHHAAPTNATASSATANTKKRRANTPAAPETPVPEKRAKRS